MDTLNDSGLLKLLDCLSYYFSVIACKYELCLTGTGNSDLNVFVNIAVSVSCKSDRLLPGSYIGLYSLYHDRCAENSSVKDCPDGSVRALPHLLKVVFLNSLVIGSNGCAFNSNTIFESCIG